MHRSKIFKISCAQMFNTLAVMIGLQKPAIVTSKHGHFHVFSVLTAVIECAGQKHGLQDGFLLTQELPVTAPGRGYKSAIAFQSKPCIVITQQCWATRLYHSFVLTFPQSWSLRRCGDVTLHAFFLCGMSCFFLIPVVSCVRGVVEFVHEDCTFC